MVDQPQNTNALLVDLDGVVRIWNPDNDRRAEQMAGLPAGAIQRTAFAPDLLPNAITGRVTDQEWRRQIAQRLQTQFPRVDGASAVEAWSASLGEVNTEVLRLLRLARASVPVVLVTNATSRLAQDLQRLGIKDEFDHIVNSSCIGWIKPQPDVFDHALQLVNVQAANALFVDDTEEHVNAAIALGLHGHVYKRLEDFQSVLERYHLISPARP